MGICLSRTQPPPGEKIVFKDLLSLTDQNLFRVAVQNCVSISAGVASKNVNIIDVTCRLSRNEGVDVTYTVSDVYELSSVGGIRNNIDSAISSGKFTGLLRKHGFRSAVATASVTTLDLSPKRHSEGCNELLVQVTQVIAGIRLPAKSLQKHVKDLAQKKSTPHREESEKTVSDKYSPRPNLITHEGSLKSNVTGKPNMRQAIDGHKGISENDNTEAEAPSSIPATELGYSTPAFRAALLRSIASSAGVSVPSVCILEITASPSGTSVDVIYTITQYAQNSTVLTRKIDHAASSGLFRSLLMEDGYASLTSISPAKLISQCYTIKQTISTLSLLPNGRPNEVEEDATTEVDEVETTSIDVQIHRRKELNGMSVNTGLKLETEDEGVDYKVKVPVVTPDRLRAQEFLEDIKRIRRNQDGGNIPGPSPVPKVEGNHALDAELTKMSEVLVAVRRINGKVLITSNAKGFLKTDLTPHSSSRFVTVEDAAPASPLSIAAHKECPAESGDLKDSAHRLLDDHEVDVLAYKKQQLRESERRAAASEAKLVRKKAEKDRVAASSVQNGREPAARLAKVEAPRNSSDGMVLAIAVRPPNDPRVQKDNRSTLEEDFSHSYNDEDDDAFDLQPKWYSKDYSQFSSAPVSEVGDPPSNEEHVGGSVWQATTNVWHAFSNMGTRQ